MRKIGLLTTFLTLAGCLPDGQIEEPFLNADHSGTPAEAPLETTSSTEEDSTSLSIARINDKIRREIHTHANAEQPDCYQITKNGVGGEEIREIRITVDIDDLVHSVFYHNENGERYTNIWTGARDGNTDQYLSVLKEPMTLEEGESFVLCPNFVTKSHTSATEARMQFDPENAFNNGEIAVESEEDEEEVQAKLIRPGPTGTIDFQHGVSPVMICRRDGPQVAVHMLFEGNVGISPPSSFASLMLRVIRPENVRITEMHFSLNTGFKPASSLRDRVEGDEHITYASFDLSDMAMSPFPYTSAYGIISTKNLQNGDELIFAMGAMTDLKMSAPGNEEDGPYYIIDNGLPMRAIVDGSQVLCHS